MCSSACHRHVYGTLMHYNRFTKSADLQSLAAVC